MNLLTSVPLAEITALRPSAYGVRLLWALVAFAAAMNIEKTVARVIGFVFLLLSGVSLLLIGLQRGTIVDTIAGLAALGAAAYSWWYTRV